MIIARRSALIAAAAVPLSGFAGPKSAWLSVQAFIGRCVAEKRYAGVAAAVSHAGQPPAFISAGTLAFDSRAAVTADSIFRIYSLTKPITGVASMLLIEDGRIALDQPVAEILPEFAALRVAIDPSSSLDSRPAARVMTVRHLLTHTSGLSNWQPSVGDTVLSRAYRERGLTPGAYGRHKQRPGYGPQVQGLRALVAGVAELPLVAEPGTAWNYSMGPDVMGAVIERVSGGSLDAFMRKRLFGPLRMASTGFQVAQSDAARLTTLYDRNAGEVAVLDEAPTSDWLKPPTLAAGGGGLASSARDLMRFAAMLLNGGELEGRRVMKPETARLIMSNILPPGVAYPPTGGFAAGAGVVIPGVKSDNGPPGAFSAVGASSTMLTIDPSRRGAAIFLAQMIPSGEPPAKATFYRPAMNAAIAADLKGVS